MYSSIFDTIVLSDAEVGTAGTVVEPPGTDWVCVTGWDRRIGTTAAAVVEAETIRAMNTYRFVI
jgi:hypothetical protein